MELIVHTVCLQLFHISYPKILHLGDRIMADYMAPVDDASSGAANYERASLEYVLVQNKECPPTTSCVPSFFCAADFKLQHLAGKSTDASTGGDDDAAVPCQRVGVFNIVPH